MNVGGGVSRVRGSSRRMGVGELQEVMRMKGLAVLEDRQQIVLVLLLEGLLSMWSQ